MASLTRRGLGYAAAGLLGGGIGGTGKTQAATQQAAELVRQFPAEEAIQAAAADESHVYAIVNSAIGKYDKKTGERVAQWSRDRQGPIRHLNSGIVLDGTLYCANSNFPETPMASSIELFDPKDLRHKASHSFGIDTGSATWIDRRDGAWYVMFAHYDERGGMPGQDHTHTQLIRYDDSWRRTGGWVFPPDILARFAPQSCSGGGFGADGLIYATAHHNTELYVLRFPAMGPVLETVAVVPNCTEGQGVAWDPQDQRVLWGISRQRRELMAWRVPDIA